MGKITFLARTSLLLIFLLGSSLSFLTAKNNKTAEINISGAVKNLSCSGENDGGISVSISGGVAPYTITWTGLSQTTEDISNLPAGSYTITVTDDEDNSNSRTFEVTEPDPLQFSSSTTTDVSCNGASDGSITAGPVSGGTPPYEYSINSNFSSTKTFSNLIEGTYSVTVKDANGCEVSHQVQVSQPDNLTMAAPASTAVSCYDGSDGTITAGDVTGGTAPFTYRLNNGNFTTQNTFQDLSAGNFTLTVKDANNCETSQEVNVAQPEILNMVTPTFTAVNCHGGNDGTITAGAVSGGTGSYQYKLNDGVFGSATTFSNLSAGTYTIAVKDANDCETSQEITLTQPEALTMVSPTFTGVSCNGGNDGTITAGAVSGGTGSYQYKLNNGAFGSATTFANLSAGTYSLTVKDANDCEIQQEVTVTEPEILVMVAPTSTLVSCFGGNDGSITAGAVTGGSGSYQYKLNNGAFGNTNTFANLKAGTYTITVKDAKACETTQEVTVSENELLKATVSFTDITCNSTNDGTINIIEPSGGSGTYQYSVNNGSSWQDSGVFTGLSNGTYPTLIRDKNNQACVISLDTHLEISRPFKLTGDISGENVSCKDGADASITISNAGGGYDLYEFSIDGSTWQTIETFNNLKVGTYSVQMRDAINKACVEILDPAYKITEPQLLVGVIESKTDVLCNGYATGSVTASATGGTAPYTYSWGSLGTGATKTNLPAGTYSVIVTDANGCAATPQSVTITQPETFIEITSVNTTSGCFQQNNGTARVEVKGGTGNYSFLWSNGQTTQTATGLAPGSHNVTVKDGNGCGITRSVTVSTPTELKITGFLTTETTAWGTATGTATAQVTGGSPEYTFTWSNGATGQTARNLPAGTYRVTVKDKNGCTTTKDVLIIDTLAAEIIPTSVCKTQGDITRTSSFVIENRTAKGGTGPYTYQWNFGTGAVPATATGPGPHEVKYPTIGEKTISVKITDSKGLVLTKTIIQYVGGCFVADCGSNDLGVDNYFIGDSTGKLVTSQNCADSAQKYLYIILPTNATRYSLYIEYIYSVTNLQSNTTQNFREFGCFYPRANIPDVAQTIPINYSCGDIVKIEGIYLTFSNNIQWTCGEGPKPKCYSTNNEAPVRSPLYAVAFPNQLLCNGSSDGTITARASGGTAPYSYSLNGGTYGVANFFENLEAGVYTVRVKDATGEVFTVQTEVTQPINPLVLQPSSQTAVTCFGGNDGTATVQASGGTPNTSGDPYIYVWDNGQTTATATNLSAGDHNVRVIDANGCEISIVVKIDQPAELLALAGPDQVLVCGTTSTTLQAEFNYTPPTGGEVRTGQWTIVNGPSGGSFSNVNDPSAIFTGTQGTYTLRWSVPCGASDDVKITINDCNNIDFDGIDDHITFGDNFNISENFALEAWIKQDPNTTSGIKTIFSKRNISGLSEGGYDLIVENNIPKFRWNNSSLVSKFPIGTDRWYHIAVIKGGDDQGLYVDGIKVNAEGTSPGSPSPVTHQFVMGAANNATTPEVPQNYFHGWIEEVRIWNTALSLEQLHFMMNQRLKNNDGKIRGVVIPFDVPGNMAWTSLSGYYQMEKVDKGFTIGEVSGSPKGKLINITTLQQRTAPLPYISNRAASWFTDNTWLHSQVWDPPGSKGIDGTTVIDWNIAVISHNISSGGKNIKLLGLLSKSAKLTIANPGETLNEKNSGQSLTITHYLQLNGVIDLVGESQLVQTHIINKEDIGHNDTALPQTIISVLDESSSGFIERDQQGTANSYNYNYWSSPVSKQGAPNNSTYTIATAMLDGTNSSVPRDLSFGGEYWFADGAFTTPRKVSNYWLNKFRGIANTYSEWERIGSTGVLNAGEGYTMKGTSGNAAISDRQNYVFKGKPNNGNISLNVDEEQNYLLGNPYPSAIDVNKFILDNLDKNIVNGATNTANIFNGAVYFWDHFAGGNTHILKEYIGGYATRNLIDGVPAISNDERVHANDDKGSKIPGQYIPVGQGFFINTAYYPENAQDVTVVGGDIVFRNSQRDFVRETNANEGNSIFLRPEIVKKEEEKRDNRAKIRIDFKSPKKYSRQILVGVDPNTTTGFDLGYDAALNDFNSEDMYWLINGWEYLIQGVPDINVDRVLPLGIKISQKGEFTIRINKLENIGDDVKIYLKDNETNSYFNLRKSDYSLNITPGTYHERFEIVFQEISETPPGEEEEEEEEQGEVIVVTPGEGGGNPQEPGAKVDPEIFYSNDTAELVVKNPGLQKITRITLHSLSGQIVQTYETIATQKEIRLPVRSYSSSVYLVKMFTENGVIHKKLIINN